MLYVCQSFSSFIKYLFQAAFKLNLLCSGFPYKSFPTFWAGDLNFTLVFRDTEHILARRAMEECVIFSVSKAADAIGNPLL